MGRGGIALFFALICLGFHVTPLDAQAHPLARYREARYVMGTILEITLYHHDAREARKYLDESFSLAQWLDELLSNFKPQSEVNQLNEKAGKGKVRISPELYDLISISNRLTLRTEGAFDITVGPLVKLWQEARKRRKPPSPASLRSARDLVGAHLLNLHPSLEVELGREGMQIDTGGIGKGYAVDQIVKLFRGYGISKALINFGHSSIYAVGSPPGDHGWKLLLQFPGQSPLGIVELKDQAMSASGTLGRSFEIGGRRYGHLIDPQSGIPLTERLQAVVLALTATEAEALSKYVILRGWSGEENLKAWSMIQIIRIGEEGDIQQSEGFPLNSLPLNETQTRRDNLVDAWNDSLY